MKFSSVAKVQAPRTNSSANLQNNAVCKHSASMGVVPGQRLLSALFFWKLLYMFLLVSKLVQVAWCVLGWPQPVTRRVAHTDYALAGVYVFQQWKMKGDILRLQVFYLWQLGRQSSSDFATTCWSELHESPSKKQRWCESQTWRNLWNIMQIFFL